MKILRILWTLVLLLPCTVVSQALTYTLVQRLRTLTEERNENTSFAQAKYTTDFISSNFFSSLSFLISYHFFILRFYFCCLSFSSVNLIHFMFCFRNAYIYRNKQTARHSETHIHTYYVSIFRLLEYKCSTVLLPMREKKT